MKAKSVKHRAASYASGKRTQGPSDWGSKVRHEAHAEGWEDGYRAALRDVKQVGADLIRDTQGALVIALAETINAAAGQAREELEKLL